MFTFAFINVPKDVYTLTLIQYLLDILLQYGIPFSINFLNILFTELVLTLVVVDLGFDLFVEVLVSGVYTS